MVVYFILQSSLSDSGLEHGCLLIVIIVSLLIFWKMLLILAVFYFSLFSQVLALKYAFRDSESVYMVTAYCPGLTHVYILCNTGHDYFDNKIFLVYL